jgi:hypothetical protein
MGLENLKSVFNDLSENQINDIPKQAGSRYHKSAAPRIIPSKPLGNILKHSTIDPKKGVYSPISDLSEDFNSFKQTPFPKIDSVFANKSIRLRGGESLIDTEIEHKFGFSTHSDINKLSPIAFRQEDSPQTKQERIKITAEEIKINKILKTEEGGLFQNLGVNSQLGNKDGPFNWTSLYNSNHTPIVERTPIDTGRVDKDGNKIEINTLRSGMGTLSNLDIMGYRSGKLDNFRGFDRGAEPYIIKPIGSKDYTTLTNRDTLPLNRALDDVSRLAKFYTSGAGVAFMAKENITNIAIGDGLTFGAIMAPPFPVPNTGFLNFYQQSVQGAGFGSIRKPFKIQYSQRKNVGLPFKDLGDGLSLVDRLWAKTPYLDMGGFGETAVDDRIAESGVESPLKLDPKKLGLDRSLFGAGGDAPLENAKGAFAFPRIQEGDFYVRIRDLRDDTYIYFRGYVTGITENVNPSFTPTNYIGRSEPVYVYERAERDLSFNLRVYPANINQFDKMYEKIEKLTSLAYPEYFPNDPGASLVRMKAPFTELYMAHIGSKVKGQFGFIKSLSYTVNDSGDWDAMTALPRLFDISISYQILNRKPPSMGDKFYRASA